MSEWIGIIQCIAACCRCCSETQRDQVICCESGDISSCCKSCWCCECKDQCCDSCSQSQVELLRVLIFMLLACGMIIAAVILFQKTYGQYNDAKKWEIQTMSCQQLCGDRFYEKKGDTNMCCYKIQDLENCEESKNNCQNMTQITQIVWMSLCGLLAVVGVWMMMLFMRSICKLRRYLQKQKRSLGQLERENSSMLYSQQQSFNAYDDYNGSRAIQKGVSSKNVENRQKKRCNHSYYDTSRRERVRYSSNCPQCR